MGIRSVVLVLALLPGVGCASTAGGSGTTRDLDVLTNQDIRSNEAEGTTAFTLIQRLRPTWLRSRGASLTQGPSRPVVFVDGIRYGEIGSLRNLNTENIREIEYMDPRDATTRFGTGFPGGVIMVTTR